MKTTIKAKLNQAGDKAYINIDDLLAKTYGDDFVKTDSGKTYKGFTVYNYQINRTITTEYCTYNGGADTKDIRSLKRDSYIFYKVVDGKIDIDNGAIGRFPNAKKAATGVVDDIMEFLANCDVVIA